MVLVFNGSAYTHCVSKTTFAAEAVVVRHENKSPFDSLLSREHFCQKLFFKSVDARVRSVSVFGRCTVYIVNKKSHS